MGFGEMAERPNAAVLKTVIPRDRDRGFESHSLLQLSPRLQLARHTFTSAFIPLQPGTSVKNKTYLTTLSQFFRFYSILVMSYSLEFLTLLKTQLHRKLMYKLPVILFFILVSNTVISMDL